MTVSPTLHKTTRFLQRRFTWTPRHASHLDLPARSSHSYLNLSPQQQKELDPQVRRCFQEPNSCTQVVDLLYYSKDENVTDYSGYDWLITANPK